MNVMMPLRILATTAVVYASMIGITNLLGAAPRHRAETAWFVAGFLATLALQFARSDSSSTASSSWTSVPTSLRLPIIFGGAAFLLFWRMIGVGFFSDDYVLLDRVAHGAYSLGNEFFRPLPMVFWGGLLAGAGPSAPLFHSANIFFHGINAYLVSRLGVRLGLPTSSAIWAGALFLVHPVSVEAVGWVSAVFDVLSTTGGLLFVLAVNSNRPAWGWLALACAFLSKESSLAYPFIALTLAYPDRRGMRAALSGIAMVVLLVTIRMVFVPLPPGYADTPSRYLVKELVSRTFGTLAAPWSASDVSHIWPLHLLAAACVGALVCAGIWQRGSGYARLAPLLAFSALLSVLPVYRYFFVSADMENSRYVYAASAFWALALICLGHGRASLPALRRSSTAVWATILVACLAAHLTRQSAWVSATQLRDAVIDQVSDVARAKRCTSVTVRALPDVERGVFVFRNGFSEAVAPSLDNAAESHRCSGQWTGSAFQLDPER